MKFLEWARFCHQFLRLIAFSSLLVLCYVFYMQEAIKDSEQKATTVTKRSENHEYEAPVITICPEPSFKPSISRQFNINVPVRDIFLRKLDFTDFVDANFLQNKTFQKMYEEFTYNNAFTYIYEGADLHLGKNEVEDE